LGFALAWVWGGTTAQAAITLTLKTSASTVALGGTLTLTATVSGTPNTGLTWSVNGVTNGNSSTGALTGSGLKRTYTAPPVNCPNPNPVTFKIVSAADNITSATATATVTSTIVVTISPTSKSLALGGTQVFTATLSGTTNTALNWYVNGVLNGNATQGTLTGCTTTAPRTCTYTAPPVNVPSPNPAVIKVASAADPGKYKTANVTVTDSIAVTLSPTSASVALGGTQLFTATLSGTINTALNWYVNGVLNGNATQGTLTGCTTTAPRTCTYTAPPVNVPSPNPAVIKVASAADPGKYKTANVTVTDSIAVTLSPTSASVALGGTQVFTATLSGTTNTALNWYVNGVLNGNATQGTLTGCTTTAPRTCTYTAPPVNVPSPNPAVIKVASAADPSKYKTANVTVTDSIAVTLSPTSASVALGGTQLFTATLSGTTNTALNWYVNGVLNGNATQGTLTGCTTTAPRTCTYTAPPVNVPSPNPAVIKVASAADPSKYKTANVTVTDSIAVTLSPTSASVALGGTQLFTATLSGTTNTALNWYVNGVLNGNATQGTLTGCTTTAPRTCTYTAPPVDVPNPNPAVIKVASAADPSKNKTAKVTVALVVAITHPSNPASVAVGSTLPITASVTGATPNITWTVDGVTNGNSTYGTISGTYPSYTYTPPTAIPGGSNPVTIEATQPGATESASLTVTINPSATTPTAVKVTAGAASVTGFDFSLSSSSSLTLALADVGTCIGGGCSASLTGIQVSRSGLATSDCTNATCTVWLLGKGLTNSGGTALASGLTVSVPHGNTTDVTVGTLTAMPPLSGFTDINFPIVVLGTAQLGNRDIVVTLGDGETQAFVGAIQIVD
jgi:hypothetical protein